MNEQEPSKKLNKQELIVIVQKLLNSEGTFDEEQAQWKALEANFVNWTEVLTDIYQTLLELSPVTLTAEEIVIKAYKRKAI